MISELDKLTVEINKIFRSEHFTKRWCMLFNYLPSDTTLDLSMREDGNFDAYLAVKHYGYESSSTGLSEYDDLGDYEYGLYNFTPQMKMFVKNYFRTRFKSIYNKLVFYE